MLPVLYLIDPREAFKLSNIESYVDDTKISGVLDIGFGFMPSLHCSDLPCVAKWCCANHVRVNPDKAKPLLFGVTVLI